VGGVLGTSSRRYNLFEDLRWVAHAGVLPADWRASLARIAPENDETRLAGGLLEVPLRGFEPRFPP
jgi:hypothetical protein